MRKTAFAAKMCVGLALLVAGLFNSVTKVYANPSQDMAELAHVLLDGPQWVEYLLRTEQGKELLAHMQALAGIHAQDLDRRSFRRSLYLALRSPDCRVAVPILTARLNAIIATMFLEDESIPAQWQLAEAAEKFLSIDDGWEGGVTFKPVPWTRIVNELAADQVFRARGVGRTAEMVLKPRRTEAIKAWRVTMEAVQNHIKDSRPAVTMDLDGKGRTASDLSRELRNYLTHYRKLLKEFSLRLIVSDGGDKDLELLRMSSPLYGDVSLKLMEATQTMELTILPRSLQDRDATLTRFFQSANDIDVLTPGGTELKGIAQISVWPPIHHGFHATTKLIYEGSTAPRMKDNPLGWVAEVFSSTPKIVVRYLPWSEGSARTLAHFFEVEGPGITPEQDANLRKQLYLRGLDEYGDPCEEGLI